MERKRVTEGFEPLANKPIAGDSVIKGVKILGTFSKSGEGRIYPIEVIRKAARLYEGCKVNLDHFNAKTQIDRTYNDRFGRIQNVRVGDDGLYGDLKFNPHHPLAESFRWWANNDPKAIGLSHDAFVVGSKKPGEPERVREIAKVYSVDLVADPATTSGLTESLKLVQEGVGMADSKVDDQDIDENGAGAAPGGDPGAGAPPKLVDDDPVDPGTPDPGTGTGEIDKDGVAAILTDPGMTSDEKLTAIALALGIELPGTGGAGTSGNPLPEAAMVKKAEEALRETKDPHYHALLSELDRYRIQESAKAVEGKARAAATKAKLPGYAVTESLISHMVSVDESRWAQILQDQRRVAVRESRPVSTAPVQGNLIKELARSLTE